MLNLIYSIHGANRLNTNTLTRARENSLPRVRETPPPQELPERVALSHSIIAIEHAALQFQDEVGVQDLNLNIAPGTIFGLIGPSGCGKTTTVRLLTGIYKPQQGKIRVMDSAPSEFPPHIRERIGYMPQQFVLYPQLSVWENMNFVASMYGASFLHRGKLLNPLLEFVELNDVRGRLASELSGGMRQRLALAASLVNQPDILFADEPTSGIDPILRSKFWEFFRAWRDRGHTVFVTTQYVGEAAYCDVIGVMREGRLIHVDTPENLRRQAMGGQVIRVHVDPARRLEVLRMIDRMEAVNRVLQSLHDAGEVFVYTDDAATTIPALIKTLNGDSGIEVHAIEKYEPPFDDIFVQLLQEESHG